MYYSSSSDESESSDQDSGSSHSKRMGEVSSDVSRGLSDGLAAQRCRAESTRDTLIIDSMDKDTSISRSSNTSRGETSATPGGNLEHSLQSSQHKLEWINRENVSEFKDELSQAKMPSQSHVGNCKKKRPRTTDTADGYMIKVDQTSLEKRAKLGKESESGSNEKERGRCGGDRNCEAEKHSSNYSRGNYRAVDVSKKFQREDSLALHSISHTDNAASKGKGRGQGRRKGALHWDARKTFISLWSRRKHVYVSNLRKQERVLGYLDSVWKNMKADEKEQYNKLAKQAQLYNTTHNKNDTVTFEANKANKAKAHLLFDEATVDDAIFSTRISLNGHGIGTDNAYDNANIATHEAHSDHITDTDSDWGSNPEDGDAEEERDDIETWFKMRCFNCVTSGRCKAVVVRSNRTEGISEKDPSDTNSINSDQPLNHRPFLLSGVVIGDTLRTDSLSSLSTCITTDDGGADCAYDDSARIPDQEATDWKEKYQTVLFENHTIDTKVAVHDVQEDLSIFGAKIMKEKQQLLGQSTDDSKSTAFCSTLCPLSSVTSSSSSSIFLRRYSSRLEIVGKSGTLHSIPRGDVVRVNVSVLPLDVIPNQEGNSSKDIDFNLPFWEDVECRLCEVGDLPGTLKPFVFEEYKCRRSISAFIQSTAATDLSEVSKHKLSVPLVFEFPAVTLKGPPSLRLLVAYFKYAPLVRHSSSQPQAKVSPPLPHASSIVTTADNAKLTSLVSSSGGDNSIDDGPVCGKIAAEEIMTATAKTTIPGNAIRFSSNELSTTGISNFEGIKNFHGNDIIIDGCLLPIKVEEAIATAQNRATWKPYLCPIKGCNKAYTSPRKCRKHPDFTCLKNGDQKLSSTKEVNTGNEGGKIEKIGSGLPSNRCISEAFWNGDGGDGSGDAKVKLQAAPLHVDRRTNIVKQQETVQSEGISEKNGELRLDKDDKRNLSSDQKDKTPRTNDPREIIVISSDESEESNDEVGVICRTEQKGGNKINDSSRGSGGVVDNDDKQQKISSAGATAKFEQNETSAISKILAGNVFPGNGPDCPIDNNFETEAALRKEEAASIRLERRQAEQSWPWLANIFSVIKRMEEVASLPVVEANIAAASSSSVSSRRALMGASSMWIPVVEVFEDRYKQLVFDILVESNQLLGILKRFVDAAQLESGEKNTVRNRSEGVDTSCAIDRTEREHVEAMNYHLKGLQTDMQRKDGGYVLDWLRNLDLCGQNASCAVSMWNSMEDFRRDERLSEVTIIAHALRMTAQKGFELWKDRLALGLEWIPMCRIHEYDGGTFSTEKKSTMSSHSLLMRDDNRRRYSSTSADRYSRHKVKSQESGSRNRAASHSTAGLCPSSAGGTTPLSAASLNGDEGKEVVVFDESLCALCRDQESEKPLWQCSECRANFHEVCARVLIAKASEERQSASQKRGRIGSGNNFGYTKQKQGVKDCLNLGLSYIEPNKKSDWRCPLCVAAAALLDACMEGDRRRVLLLANTGLANPMRLLESEEVFFRQTPLHASAALNDHQSLSMILPPISLYRHHRSHEGDGRAIQNGEGALCKSYKSMDDVVERKNERMLLQRRYSSIQGFGLITGESTLGGMSIFQLPRQFLEVDQCGDTALDVAVGASGGSDVGLNLDGAHCSWKFAGCGRRGQRYWESEGLLRARFQGKGGIVKFGELLDSNIDEDDTRATAAKQQRLEKCDDRQARSAASSSSAMYFGKDEDISGGRERFPVKWYNEYTEERLRRFPYATLPVIGVGVGVDWRSIALSPSPLSALAAAGDCSSSSSSSSSSSAWTECTRCCEEAKNAGTFTKRFRCGQRKGTTNSKAPLPSLPSAVGGSNTSSSANSGSSGGGRSSGSSGGRAELNECGPLCACATLRHCVRDPRYGNAPVVPVSRCPVRNSQRPMPYPVSIRMTVAGRGAKGWGLFTDVSIPEQAYIGCYGGEMVTSAEGEERSGRYAQNDEMASYVFDLTGGISRKAGSGNGSSYTNTHKNKKPLVGEARPASSDTTKGGGNANSEGRVTGFDSYCLDAQRVRNVFAFLNHSCRPNVEVRYVLPGHRDRRAGRQLFFAKTHINAGSELCFNYGPHEWKKFGDEGCRCDHCELKRGSSSSFSSSSDA